MPPRRRAAATTTATAASAATPPLDGITVAVSGKFDDIGHTHDSLESLVVSLGGGFSRSVTAKTTHLICTEYDFNASSSKIASAIARNLKIVGPEWLIEADSKKTKPDEEDYSWQDKKTSVSKKNAITQAAATTDSKKRAAAANTDDGADDADDKPKIKKTKAAALKAPAAKAEGKAAIKDEPEPKDEPEETKDEEVVAEGQFIKKKGVTIPVDEYCPLVNYAVFVDPDSGMIYDAALNQSNSTNNNNKFYRVQILVEEKSKTYKTWTRWGRVGEAGQKAVLGNGTLPDALKNFGKKFKDKSGLTWDNRGETPRPGKYAFVERSYNPDSDDEDEDDAKAVKKETEEEAPPPECTLEKPVQELMELIFNQQYFQATMSALNYDANKLPLGKLSKTTITRGFQQLKDLAALMDDSTLAQSQWNMTYGDATEHLSNTYYSVIPHAFGRNRPPVIRGDSMLKKEIELLESLSDMKDAAEIMKIDRKTREDLHPLDRQFNGLNLKELSVLDHSSNEFNLLEKHLNNTRGATHHVNYEVQEIFRIEREGETKRFDDSEYSKISSDRRLLWHGSRCTNFGGILSQGLRIAPPEAPVSGYMFGKGIYLADMSSKSAGYCASYNTAGQALLLLCEAELGDPMQKLTQANYNAGSDAKKQGMHSTWGQGKTSPSKWIDAEVVHESLKGIKMPDINTQPAPANVQGAGLYFNEFIVYDVAQIKLRYLLRVKM